jgi:NAD(P)-dependent dehydrogenase (short-subunit alcohol dehydrogenase family)
MSTNLSGKKILVTGATSGIGEVTAIELARMGAHVGIVARSPERAEATLAKLRAAAPGSTPELYLADLSVLREVTRVGAEYKARHGTLDVLVNNAGALHLERKVTADGLEMTFAVNHMAYFVLTNALREVLTATPGARVVSVASDAHRAGRVDFDDLSGERAYAQVGGGWKVYGTSKLMNILWAAELARRLDGTGVTSNSLHPGVVATGFARNEGGIIAKITGFFSFMLTTPDDGARTTVHLASSPSVATTTGLYFKDCKPKTPLTRARDAEVARRLWDISEAIAARHA